MTDLVDYSGEFDPHFSHDTFTRQTLFALLKFYAAYLKFVDGTWYSTVSSRWGGKEALECDRVMLKRARVYEAETLSSLLNIRGDDVATMMKLMQLSPWVQTLELEVDLKDNDHAIYTVRVCPTLAILEKEGKGSDTTICIDACMASAGITARYCNPKIKITPLKLAPRESKDDICCRWEFKLER